MRKIENVRRWLKNDNPLSKKQWRVDDFDVITDGSMLVAMAKPRCRRTMKPSDAEVARRIIGIATRRRKWKRPTMWLPIWSHDQYGASILIGRTHFQARYVTACRYVLGPATEYALAKVEHPNDPKKTATAFVARSPLGVAVVMQLRSGMDNPVVATW